VAGILPGARVVKAFNHLAATLLAADPRARGGHRLLFVAGDDAPGKAAVAGLAERLGFLPVDLGGLAEGGRLSQFPGGALAAMNLVQFG
jgi:predicted dinucleotide-binding enzyme